MERVDSLLSILVQHGADELRLGAGREPKMFARGGPARLSLPTTPEEMLRELLGAILSAERERLMRERGHVEVDYESRTLGRFRAKLSARPGTAFDVVFQREAAAGDRASEPVRAPPLDASAPPPGPGAPTSTPVPAPAPAPGCRATDRRVLAAAALRASDLHLADGEAPRARVDGALRLLGDAPVDVASALDLPAPEQEAVARGRSCDLRLEVPPVGAVRVHVFRTAGGTAAAVRLFPAAAPTLASLGLPVPLDDVVDLPHGLVLVCGATGSGKSTTLAALAQEALRRRSIVLCTLEDPIELALEPSPASVVRRRQVGRDVPDFAAGLRDALREDPDVLLVGEMRDPDTIGLALTAAETGHLVLSSLHSGSAASAVERIVDAYPPARQHQVRVQLADSLRAVVAQRLLPRRAGSGRVLAVEVLRVTHAVGALIRDGKTAQIASAMQAGKREGMLPLEKCLADLVRAGEIDLAVARQAANEAESLAMYSAR